MSGCSIFWHHPWPLDAIDNLVSATKLDGNFTNSVLEVDVLILHEATLSASVPSVRISAPCSGSYNIPTISCSMREASTINLVVADLLHISALHYHPFFLNSFVLYHLGQDSFMAYDASRLFDLPDTSFLAQLGRSSE